MGTEVCSVRMAKCGGGAGGLRLFSVSSMSRAVMRSKVTFGGRSVRGGLALFLCPSSDSRGKELLQVCRRCFVMDTKTRLVLSRYATGKYGLRSLTSCTIVRVGSARPAVMVPRLVHVLMREKLSVSRTVRIISGAYTCAGRAVLTRTLRG